MRLGPGRDDKLKCACVVMNWIMLEKTCRLSIAVMFSLKCKCYDPSTASPHALACYSRSFPSHCPPINTCCFHLPASSKAAADVEDPRHAQCPQKRCRWSHKDIGGFRGATIQDEAGSQRDIFYHMRFKFASMVHLVPCRTTDVCNEAQRILREVDLSNFYHECMLSVCPLSP
jgi:hypothetical protein